MNEEKLMVLKMIDEGKITAEEGIKLIKAIGGRDSSKENDFEEKMNKFSQNVDCFAKDSKEWIEGIAKDVEPKFKKAAKVVVEKTASVVDDLSKVLRDTVDSISAGLEKESGDEEEAVDDESKEN